MSSLKILGIIPARGGSKGVPHKNARMLAGKPLIQWTYECATASGVVDRLILSSDDNDCIEIAKKIGIEVPFVRPSEYAADNSAMIDVVVHALTHMIDSGYTPDAVLLLQPTSPLRKPEYILKALDLLGDADSVCSVTTIPKTFCPHFVMRIREDGCMDYFLPEGRNYTRRQDVPQAYTRNGNIYLTRTNVILEQHNLYGQRCIPLVQQPEDELSIDTIQEWEEAERRLLGQ